MRNKREQREIEAAIGEAIDRFNRFTLAVCAVGVIYILTQFVN